jgi:hypothetical protein
MKLATVARPSVIVSTRIDTDGLSDQAQTVTFTATPGVPPGFDVAVRYAPPDEALAQHLLTVLRAAS